MLDMVSIVYDMVYVYVCICLSVCLSVCLCLSGGGRVWARAHARACVFLSSFPWNRKCYISAFNFSLASESMRLLCECVFAVPHEVSLLFVLWSIASGHGVQRILTVTNGAQVRYCVVNRQSSTPQKDYNYNLNIRLNLNTKIIVLVIKQWQLLEFILSSRLLQYR